MTPEDIIRIAEQEPVAWMWDYKRLDGHVETKVIFAHRYKDYPGDLAYILDGKDATPLYAAPPKRESLTDEELYALGAESHEDIAFVRRVLAAHGIGVEE